MPLADDTLGTSIVSGEGFTPLFMDPTPGPITQAPNPSPGPVGLNLFDNSIWKDNNLGDDPRFVFRPRPGATGAAIFPDSSSWYVDQWWIFPRPVNFGNILETETITVGILNTFRGLDLTFDAVDLSAFVDVTNVANPPPFPIRTLEQKSIDFQAAGLGVPSFDANAIFTFSNRTVSVRMLGQRIVLFPFAPEQPLIEQISWLTNIMKSRDQTEQRHSLRERPRQKVEMEILTDSETTAATMRNILFEKQWSLFGIPEWWDMRLINSSTALPVGTTVIPMDPDNAMFFATRDVVFILPDGTAVSGAIDSVQAGASITLAQPTTTEIPAGSFAIPLATGILVRAPTYNDFKVNQQVTRVQFELNSSEDLAFSDAAFTASAFDKHPVDGLLVLTDRNLLAGPRFRHSVTQDVTRVDSGIGQVHQVEKDAIALPSKPKGKKLKDVAEIWQWKQLLHFLRGSWKAFYLPTFQNDLPVNVSFDLNSTSIVIDDIGATEVGFGTPHRDVFIEVLTDGRNFTRRVTNIIDNGDGTETVSLNSAPTGTPEVISAADIRVSWAEFVRIDGDVATFIYDFVGQGKVRFNVKGVKE